MSTLRRHQPDAPTRPQAADKSAIRPTGRKCPTLRVLHKVTSPPPLLHGIFTSQMAPPHARIDHRAGSDQAKRGSVPRFSGGAFRWPALPFPWLSLRTMRCLTSRAASPPSPTKASAGTQWKSWPSMTVRPTGRAKSSTVSRGNTRRSYRSFTSRIPVARRPRGTRGSTTPEGRSSSSWTPTTIWPPKHWNAWSPWPRRTARTSCSARWWGSAGAERPPRCSGGTNHAPTCSRPACTGPSTP